MSWRARYPFGSHWMPVEGGHRVHYVDEGAGPPVLMVHGNPTWSFYWRALIQDLAPDHRCVAIDHLGCGLSDKPEPGPYRLADRVTHLVRLVEHLDLRALTLVVHDWGGAIGFGMAARVPDRVARVVVTNTGAFPFDRIPLRIAACRVPGLGPLAVRGFNGFAAAAITMATERGLAPDVRAGLLAPYDSWAHRVAVQAFVDDIPMSSRHPSWPALLESERGVAAMAGRPALIAWGERDWCFTPAFRQEFERRLPGAEVERYADAGHYVMEDAVERIVPRIRRFLQ